MTMTRKASLHVWMLLLCVVLAACRDRDAAERPGAGPPVRLVSQTVISDEILWELGEDVRTRVVGVSKMADDPTYSGIVGKWPTHVPRVPGSNEALVAARPDLVMLADFTSAETKALLEHAGIATLVLEGFDGFDAFRRHTRTVAERIEARAEGEALIRRFDEALAAHEVQERSAGATVVSWVEGMVAGAGTTFDDQARAAGLVNAAALHGVRGHRSIPVELLTTWNPDIIVTGCHEDCEAARERIASAPGLAATTAARSGRIVAIESRLLYSTGLGMVEVVKILRTSAS
jgi:iron complex transport system substrate-binding protein